MEESPVSYKSLRKVQQAEQTAAVLTKLETGFYRDVTMYVRALEHSVDTEKNVQKGRLFAEELANMKKLIAGVYDLREKKIVSAAVVAARGGEPDIKNLAEEERPFYTGLVQVIAQVRQRILSTETDLPAEPSVPPTIEEPPAEPPAPQPERPTLAPPPPAQANSNPLLRVTQDMPRFVGTDLKVYELRKDDVLSLPPEMAAPLLKRGVLTPIE
jgi:DNA replication factor GINS